MAKMRIAYLTSHKCKEELLLVELVSNIQLRLQVIERHLGQLFPSPYGLLDLATVHSKSQALQPGADRVHVPITERPLELLAPVHRPA